MYFLDDPKGEVFCNRGSLYFPHLLYVSFFPFALRISFSSERMLYSTKERFAMRKSFAVRIESFAVRKKVLP